MLTIRAFRPQDAETVRALFARGQLDWTEGTDLEDEARRYIQRSLDADLSDIPANYVHRPRSNFWVAELAGEIKGAVGVQEIDQEEAELRRMSVAADSRRQGIGARLLATVEDFCREQFYSRVALSTVLHLEAAVIMYESHGYRRLHQEPYGKMTVQYFVKDLVG